MLLLISPAKTLDTQPIEIRQFTSPVMLRQSAGLIKVLKKLKATDLKDLMDISDDLAALNVARFKAYKTPFTPENAKPAVYMFRGDVYGGLDIDSFQQEDILFAQDHLRILSGLYGLLKPLDLIQPYRLEMGTSLVTEHGNNLYDYWGDKITQQVKTDLKLEGSGIIINLASQEYFKAVKPKLLKGKLINVHFKENRNGVLKIISFSAKRARGLMSRYIIQHQLTNPEDIKSFNLEGYNWDSKLSTETDYVFIK
jgi:cytoplasmic iron level regulating protein YaaA (DUF328/UPF0246 family)